jgi:hypothetical protein
MRKANGHTEEFIKRRAKAIKKADGITHHEALDKAAAESGFTNWNGFLNASK